jgi:hypothetical protein
VLDRTPPNMPDTTLCTSHPLEDHHITTGAVVNQTTIEGIQHSLSITVPPA